MKRKEMSTTEVNYGSNNNHTSNFHGLPFNGACISGSILGTLHIFTHLILIITQVIRQVQYFNLNFADEGNEAH